jgi:hypothetical protein
MSTQSIFSLFETPVVRLLDSRLCALSRLCLMYDRYKTGEAPDYSLMEELTLLGRIVCNRDCDLNEEERIALAEKINRLNGVLEG